jgi:hypothetical protein
MTTRTETYCCERCGEKLNPAAMKWLELNMNTGRYSDPEVTPLREDESQGCFTFGVACAAAVLKAGGSNRVIGRLKR